MSRIQKRRRGPKRSDRLDAASVTITESGQILTGTGEQKSLQKTQRLLDLQGLGSVSQTTAATIGIEFLIAANVDPVLDMGENFSFQDEPSANNSEEIDNPNIQDPDINNSSGHQVEAPDKFPDSEDPFYNLDEDISAKQVSEINANMGNSAGQPAASSLNSVAETGVSCMVSYRSAGEQIGETKLSVINISPQQRLGV